MQNFKSNNYYDHYHHFWLEVSLLPSLCVLTVIQATDHSSERWHSLPQLSSWRIQSHNLLILRSEDLWQLDNPCKQEILTLILLMTASVISCQLVTVMGCVALNWQLWQIGLHESSKDWEMCASNLWWLAMFCKLWTLIGWICNISQPLPDGYLRNFPKG